jgi:hypothetical protein
VAVMVAAARVAARVDTDRSPRRLPRAVPMKPCLHPWTGRCKTSSRVYPPSGSSPSPPLCACPSGRRAHTSECMSSRSEPSSSSGWYGRIAGSLTRDHFGTRRLRQSTGRGGCSTTGQWRSTTR